VKQKLRLGVSVEGNPPSQLLRVVANQAAEVSRVEYMLSSEATIEAEDVSKQGDKIDIPINDGSVLKLWNTPRADRNNYDHSGPAKIAVTVSVDGQTNQYILPVQMQAAMQANTMFRKLVGSKTFYGS
jgi:UDP-3-O-acyl-N-acetylglucosamine deacetylase